MSLQEFSVCNFDVPDKYIVIYFKSCAQYLGVLINKNSLFELNGDIV